MTYLSRLPKNFSIFDLLLDQKSLQAFLFFLAISFIIKIDEKKFYETRKVTQLSFLLSFEHYTAQNFNFDVFINTFAEDSAKKNFIIAILTKIKLLFQSNKPFNSKITGKSTKNAHHNYNGVCT